MKQEIVWILIVITFITGFLALQGATTITGYTTLGTQTTILTDIQIHSETSISPLLDITIPIEQPTLTIPDLTYGYIQIRPITENFTYMNILFKVSNSWVLTNKLEKQEIALYRFDKEWQQLPTSLEKQTKDFTHYKARTQELGLFAIAKATKVIHIEEPAPTTKPTKLTPFLIITIILLASILTIELFSLIKHKLRLILIILAFAVMILGLTVQQPITKEILTFGLLPLIVIALIISAILTITLNKLRKHKSYPYIRNIIILIISTIIFITSSTTSYTKDVIIYAILPLITLSIIASAITTLVIHINSKLKKNRIYKNIRNIIISLAFILIIVKLLHNTIYYLKSLSLMITILCLKLFKKENIKLKKTRKKRRKSKI